MRHAFRAAAILVAILVLGAGCSTHEDTPDPAFERLRVAIVGGDARLLYAALDTESRWAVDTVYRYHKDIASLVQAKFPAEARDRELVRLGPAARDSEGAPAFLSRQTMVTAPMSRLPADVAALGKLAKTEPGPNGSAVLVTSTGLRLPFGPGADGRWGYLGLHDELVRWRDASANDFKRLSEEAKLYP